MQGKDWTILCSNHILLVSVHIILTHFIGKTGEQVPNIQDLFNQILVETINRPGDESMNEDEKVLLLKDMKRLGLKMPPPSYTPPPTNKAEDKPWDEDLFEDDEKEFTNKVDSPKDEVKQSDYDEEEKIPSTCQKSTKKKSVPPMDVIKQRAISTYSDVRPINDEGLLGVELSEEDEEDEPDNPVGASNTKWNLFGSLKKFFFKGPPPTLSKKNESESIILEKLPDEPIDTNNEQTIKEEPKKVEKETKNEKSAELMQK